MQTPAKRTQNKPPQRLKITLALLMWWLTAIAILLALHRDILDAPPDPEDLRDTSAYVSRQWFLLGMADLLAFPFQALAICCLGRWLWSRCRALTCFPTEPGHWMLLCIAIHALCQEVRLIAVKIVTNPVTDFSWNRVVFCHLTHDIVVHSLLLLLAAVATSRFRHVKIWAAIFAVFAAAQALFAFENIWSATPMPIRVEVWLDSMAVPTGLVERNEIMLVITNGLYSIAKLLLYASALLGIGAIVIDLKQRNRRDLLHWLGIVSLAALKLPAVVFLTSRFWAP